MRGYAEKEDWHTDSVKDYEIIRDQNAKLKIAEEIITILNGQARPLKGQLFSMRRVFNLAEKYRDNFQK